MTSTLAGYIRLARSRVYSNSLNAQARPNTLGPYVIEDFKRFLSRNVQLAVQTELFSDTRSTWHADGRSVQFAVDDDTFVLQQIGLNCRLFHRIQGRNIPMALLAANSQFEDRLLVAIDDAIQGEN
jgi:hypothetical protein